MKKLNMWGVATFFIILIGIVLRLWRLDIPFDPEDVNLDYLAAHQMVEYGQIPWSGSGNPLLIDSPLYYYIVAFFVWIYDHLLFLTVINIVLIQGATFWIFYRMATELFGVRTGVLTVFLAVMSFEYVAEGSYFFQTHVMQLFVNASFLFLILVYKEKKLVHGFYSVFLFIVALTIHHSVLALGPMYALLVFLAMPDANRRWRQFSMMVVFACVVFAIFHAPLLALFAYDTTVVRNIALSISNGYTILVSEIAQKITYNFAQFFYAFSLRWRWYAWIINSIAALVWIGSLVSYMRSQPKQKTLPIWIIFAAIIQFVLIASFLTEGVWNFTFSSLFGVYVMVLAAISMYWFSGSFLKKMWAVGVIGLTLYVCANGGMYLSDSDRLSRWQIFNESTRAMEQSIRSIYKAENRANFSFFGIQRVRKKPADGFYVDVYTKQGIQVRDSLLYLPELQKRFHTPLVRMEKDGGFPTLLNENEFMFVICDSTRANFKNFEDCLNRYIADSPQYVFVKPVYEKYPIAILLMRRLGS